MSVQDVTPYNSSTADGSTSTFAYSFLIYDEAHIQVKNAGVVKALTTDYTVTGVGNPSGGTVVFNSGKWPASGALVERERVVPYERSADFTLDYRGDVVDKDADLIVMMAQQIRFLANLGLRLPKSAGGVSSDLPSPEALKFLRWNAAANAIENMDIAGQGLLAVSDFMKTVLPAVNAAAARSTLGAVGLADANTFTAGQTVQSTDAGATKGPIIKADRSSASPAASDEIGVFQGTGRSLTAVERVYYELVGKILDPTNASEDAAAIIRAMVAGALTDILTIGPGLQVGAPTGGDKGAGTGNFQNGVYDGGIQLKPNLQAKAWVNFNGTGTISIRGQQNVTSITDNGVGDYTVNYTTAMSDADYAVAVCNTVTSSTDDSLKIHPSVAPGTTSVRLQNVGTNYTDPGTCCVVIFGN